MNLVGFLLIDLSTREHQPVRHRSNSNATKVNRYIQLLKCFHEPNQEFVKPAVNVFED